MMAPVSSRLTAPPRRIRLRRGLDLRLNGAPGPVIEDGPPVRSVALLAADYPGLRPDLLVEVGDQVRLGQPLVADRRRPDVVHGSPGSGRVTAIHRGAKRSLESIVIALDGDSEVVGEVACGAPDALADLSREQGVSRLLACGLWSALRSRPGGGVALPTETPRALCVTAMDTRPLAPDPALVIASRPQDFADGLAVLGRLVDGPLYLCARPGAELPGGDPDRVHRVDFCGPHPAGLAGTHIHFLAPVSSTSCTWSVGYQDVIAIGRLFTAGRLDTERVVALCGPMVRRPRLVRTRLGASVDDLLRDESLAGPCRIVSGSVLDGRRAFGTQAFLGRYHDQVCALSEERDSRSHWWPSGLLGWRVRGRATPKGDVFTTSRRGPRGPLLSMPGFDRVMPLDVLPGPLLRALRVGDDEAVEALGGLELVEEDLALCTYVCPGKIPWGRLLRAFLKRHSEHAR